MPVVIELNLSTGRANEGEPVSFSAFANDSDGSVVRYRWESNRSQYPLTPLATGGPFSLANLTPGDHLITVIVQDNEGAWSVPATATLYVNARPSVSIEAVPPRYLTCEQMKTTIKLTFNAQASDADGAVLLYRWDFDGDGVWEANTTEPVAIYSDLGSHLPEKLIVKVQVQDNEGTWSNEAKLELNISQIADCDGFPQPPPDDTGEGFLPGTGMMATLVVLALVFGVANYRRRL